MTAADIKHARERAAKAVTLRPSVGQNTSVSRARIVDGLTCEITEGDWTLIADAGKSEGGAGRGPTPGVLGRGALGSCYAISVVMWAAQCDLPLHAVSVEVQAEWDARGELGLDDSVVPGYSQVRVLVEVESPAPESAVRDMLQQVERYSPYIDVFRRAHDVVVEPRITSRQAAE